MKVKTFILTFLMMMSSPFLFGQHWTDPGNSAGYQNSMILFAQVVLDDATQVDNYQVAAFNGDELLRVTNIIPFQGTTSNYHVHFVIPGNSTMDNIYFKFFDGEKEYVSETTYQFQENGMIGSHDTYETINFKTVAQIEGTEYDVVYPSLQDAIDAVENEETITLLDDNAENVTVVQAPNMAFTIDGAEKTMTGTITVNGKSAAYETAGLTIKKVKFDATGIAADASIMLGVSGNNNTRYTNGVTIEDCDFTGNGQTKAAIKNYTGGCKNLTVTGGTFSGLHSLMQVKGVDRINVSGVTISDCENGIAVGTSTNVAISNSTIAATGYGVRADGGGDYTMTLTNNNISAELPVVVRYAKGNYNLTIAGENNSYTAYNTNAYQVVFTNGDDGTYEAPTGEFSLTVSEGTKLNVYPVYEAKIGNAKYLTLAEAIAAVGAGNVVIELLADATFDYNARDAYGTAETTSLTINGNGKTLTLNQKNSDWASLGLANTAAKLVLNNMTIEKTGYGDTSGAWNTHAIIFSCPLEMTGVTVNNSMAVQNGATLNNVVINEANGFYGLWINGNGQSVTMNGGSITATNGGRGIKIADQYIDSPVSVTLKVAGTTFKTAKKAAVLVSSTAGAAITASNVNITNVAEDNVNFAWVDEDWAANYGKVTVTDATLSQENLPAFATAIKVDGNVQGYYKTLAEAIAAVGENSTVEIELLKDIALDAMLTVNKNRTITLDLNGKTITGTDKTNKNFSLIDNRGTLTVTGEGKMTLTATTNSGWNRYSAVIANNPGGKLIIENGTFEHLGGTDMAYGIDNLTNGKGTYAETVINGGTIKSTYRGIRQFLNGVEAQNILTVNGGTIEGANKSIWMHDPSTNANTGKLTVSAEAKLKGDVYLFVTAGSTEWPVEISIAAAALQGESTVLTANLPAGVDVQNINGTYSKVNVVAAIGETKYQTLDAAFTAAQNDDEVKILVAGTYALNTSGKNITITGAVDGVVFDNIGAKNMGSANVTFNNVTFDYYPNKDYTGLQHSGNLVYNNCIINGQVFLYGTSEKFNNCTFNQNSAGAYNVWTYGAKEVAFNECTFNSVGKSVLIYSEDKNLFNNVAVTDCDFIASAPVDGKAAIEMDSSLTAGINLTIDGETTATGFGSGNVSNNSLWNNKKGNQGANNDIKVTVNNVVVLAPTTVAKIGETEYQLLQNAVNAAAATDVIDVVGTTTENITIAENANITLNFAENVVLNGYIAPFKGNLTISGGTINNTNADYSAIEINAGELNLENVKVSSARHGVRIDGAVTATINGGEYTLNATSGTRHAVNVSGAANVTIQAGTFVGPKGTTMDSGSAVCVQTGATVTIEGGNFSGGKNATLGVSGTMTVIGGTFDQDPSAYVSLPYVVIKNDNVYNVIKGVAKIGETYYASLASAIKAATAGNTIELLTDIEENVTVNKSVTIDGGNKNYTGTMTGNAALTVTVKNLNFVNAWFDKSTKSSTGGYTFINCTFDGGNKTQPYAFRFKGANSVTIEDCTVKNYQYSFLYITSSTLNVSVKNVTVENCPSYAVYFASGVTTATIEGLTVKNSSNGFVINNTANRALTIKNCKLENVTTAINHANGTNSITCTMLGDENDFGTSASSQYAKYVLAAADATLAAPEGLNVTTSVENSLVKYEDGKYIVKPAVAKIGDVYYETLTEAINAANDGATIQVLPVTISEYVFPWPESNHSTEKSITIVGSKDADGNLTTTMTGGMYLGYDDSQCREHTIVVKDINFTGKGLKVACQQNVTIEGNTFTNITEGQAILVIGKNINSVVKNNVIDNVTSAQGIELRNTLTATVEGNTISNTGHNSLQITSQVGATNSEITVTNNTMSNWGMAQNAQGVLEGRAMRVNDIVKANINGNVMSHTAAPEEFVKVTGSTTLDASANYWNGVSPLTEGMFTGVEGDLVPVLKSYYTDVEKTNLVILQASVAKIGETYYPSLAAAITAANAGDEILIIAENGVTEDVAVNKDLTINGNNKDYTGNISVKGSTVDVIVKNVNFVNGTGYAITTNTIKSVTVENCTVTNYGYGFLYANKSTPTVAVKNVTVDGANYGMHWVYGTTATLENVTMKNVVYGLYIQNYASKTINVKSCNISSIAIWERNGYSGVQTFKFEGASTVGTLESSQYAKYVLAAADATLAAPEGLNVTTNVTDHVVEYNEGVYSVVAANVELLSNEGVSKGKFATLQQAIDAAQSGDEIVLLADINLDETEFVLLDNSYDTYFKVEGKSVTINLNGKKISGSYTGTNTMLVGVFSTDNNGHLTLKDENTEGVTAEINVTATNTVYSLIANYEDGCSITIEGGTYVLDNASDSHMYTGGDEGIIVNGGTFKLGNVGTGTNGKPWMFNTLGGNERNVVVNGGTFSTDVNHQFWANEVYVPETKALSQNADGTWTVVESVAYVTERATSTGAYDRKVGYATLAEAVVAKATDNTVTMLINVELANTLTIAAGNEVVLDLNEKVVSQTTEFTASYSMITNNGKLTIGNGTLKLEDLSEGGSSNWGTYIVENHGELIVNNAKLEHLGTAGDNFSTCIPIQNYQGKVTVNEGAEISSPEFRSLRDFTAGGEIIINGGKFNGQIWMQGLGNGSSSLTINGGEFGPTANDGSSVFITNGTNVINVSILGGNFNTKIGATNAEKEGVKGCIKGGYFTTTAKENTNAALLNENFAFVANDDATYTWTVMPTQKQSLVAGWNWYSSYLNVTTEGLLGALGTNGLSVVQNSSWTATYDNGWWYSDHTFDISKMYMIQTSSACEMSLNGELADASTITITLNPGWNWIGYPSNVETSLATALSELGATHNDLIKDNKGGLAQYYDKDGVKMWLDMTLPTMEPTQGYMYYNQSEEQKTFTYTIVPTRGSKADTENYYAVDATKYPYNMTMTAVVDGAMDNNYEVAAFVNGEVRGSARPVYVEPMDAYMLFLSISGDDVEEMTFKYYDITTGEECNLNNRINYSNNAIVGSVNEPYVFSRGTTGIGEASLSEINIYPNPTTIGTEINLQATCDKVEVFNALGVKLAEYQNVDSIDAIETAGIYVIRITNDSNVQNCRLVVK